jgi:hypothetical protein
MNEYTSAQYDFSPSAQPIQYFKLDAAMFQDRTNPTSVSSAGKFTTAFHQASIAAGTYLSRTTHLSALDPTYSDTTVLSFQVGTGKTEVLLDYVEQYASAEGYVVFYCAPFLRLISEINAKLEHRGVTCFDCTKLANQNEEAKVATPTIPESVVYLMTPDFLLSSGGRKSAPQSARKRIFKEELRSHLHMNGRKVILVLDEIHEKTSVFDAERLPHLLEWYGIVHKVFVASATFTHDSVEVTKALSFLTERRIAVFQADRVKAAKQARLHLHICAQNYSERNLHGLAGLAEVVRDDPHRKFHLLAAFKNLAKKLLEDKDSVPSQAVNERTPKPLLLTADNKTNFNASRCSIGTTFKTGVNITNDDALLIAVLPGGGIDNADATKLGAFSDMRSSVVQAFARVRNGGDIHVFMPPFTSYMHNADFVLDAKCEHMLQSLCGDAITSVWGYKGEQELFDEFTQLHYIRQQKLAAFKRLVGAETATVYDGVIGFDRLYNYTLAEYPSFRDSALEDSKQGLGPLVLWMALNEQFTNCSLASVTVERYTGATVSLPKEMKWTSFLQNEVKRRLQEYRPSSIHEAIDTILHKLGENLSGQQITYVLDPRTSGLKNGTLRQLYDQAKVITEAVFVAAESAASSEQVKKADRFKLLLRTAGCASQTAPASQESNFVQIQDALKSFKQQVLGASKNISGILYLPESFTDGFSEETKQAESRLIETLRTSMSEVPLLRHGVVPLPGYSKSNLTDYRDVALRLLFLELDLPRPSRKGRKEIFGEQTPYYRIPSPSHSES